MDSRLKKTLSNNSLNPLLLYWLRDSDEEFFRVFNVVLFTLLQYRQLGKGATLHFHKLPSISPIDALNQVWLNFSQRFCKILKIVNAILPFSFNFLFVGVWQFIWIKQPYLFKNILCSVGIRVRIRVCFLFACRKRQNNGPVLQKRPQKPKPRVTAGMAR